VVPPSRGFAGVGEVCQEHEEELRRGGEFISRGSQVLE
jgi:hypothetical protein